MKLAVRKKDNQVMNDIQDNLNTLKGIVAQFGGREEDYLLLDVPPELAEKIRKGVRYIKFDGKRFILEKEALRPPAIKLDDGKILLTRGWVRGNEWRDKDEEVDDPNFPYEQIKARRWAELTAREKELFWERMKKVL